MKDPVEAIEQESSFSNPDHPRLNITSLTQKDADELYQWRTLKISGSPLLPVHSVSSPDVAIDVINTLIEQRNDAESRAITAEHDLALVKIILSDPNAVRINMQRGTIAYRSDMLADVLGVDLDWYWKAKKEQDHAKTDDSFNMTVDLFRTCIRILHGDIGVPPMEELAVPGESRLAEALREVLREEDWGNRPIVRIPVQRAKELYDALVEVILNCASKKKLKTATLVTQTIQSEFPDVFGTSGPPVPDEHVFEALKKNRK